MRKPRGDVEISSFTGFCKANFSYFADRASQYIYLITNQLDALNFIMNMFHASIMFQAFLCSLSGGQNCIIQHLVPSH